MQTLHNRTCSGEYIKILYKKTVFILLSHIHVMYFNVSYFAYSGYSEAVKLQFSESMLV